MECLFCGGLADSREHVIPAWLQKYHGISNQRLFLPNRTTIPYRQITVPSCTHCNTSQFSQLETRILEESAAPDDYYLWALKIHWGLMYRDTNLLVDRSSPMKGPVLYSGLISQDLELARRFFQCVFNRHVQFQPSPFGSVILLDTSKTEFERFDVVHSFGIGCLALTLKTKLLIVFFNDRQAVVQNVDIKMVKKKVIDGLMLRFFLLDIGYWVIRRRDIPAGVLAIEGQDQRVVIGPGSFVKPYLADFDDEEFKILAGSLGIRVEKTQNSQWSVQYLRRATRKDNGSHNAA